MRKSVCKQILLCGGLSLFTTLQQYSARGQSIVQSPQPIAPTNMYIGQALSNYSFEIDGYSSGGSSSAQVTISLPVGFIVDVNSFSGTGGITVSNVNVNSGSNATTVTIAVANIPQAPNKGTVSYKAGAGCQQIGANNVTTAASYQISTNNTQVQSNVTTIEYAVLNLINGTNTSYTNAVVGQTTFNRTYQITNGGNNKVDTIYWNTKIGNGLQLNSLTANNGTVTLMNTTSSATDTTRNYRIVYTLNTNASITITENVSVKGCNNLSSTASVYYMAGGVKCNSTEKTTNSGVSTNATSQPNLLVIKTHNNPPQCFGTVHESGFALANIGTAPSTRVLVELWNSWATSLFTPTLADNYKTRAYLPASFKYKIGVNGTYQSITLDSTRNYTNPFPYQSGNVGKVNFQLGNIMPNDTLFVVYDVKNVDNPNCSITYRLEPRDIMRFRNTDACGTLGQYGEMQGLNSHVGLAVYNPLFTYPGTMAVGPLLLFNGKPILL